MKNVLPEQFYKDYLDYIRPTNLFSKLSEEKFKEFSFEIKKVLLGEKNDLEKIGELKLVRYKDQKNCLCSWENEGAENLKLLEDYQLLVDNNDENVGDLIKSLRNGLTGNIEIIVAVDGLSNEKIIVDGIHRIVALFYLLFNDHEAISKIFESEYKIYIIEIKSRNMRSLFPCDFVNI
jgi:hypothetical protein